MLFSECLYLFYVIEIQYRVAKGVSQNIQIQKGVLWKMLLSYK